MTEELWDGSLNADNYTLMILAILVEKLGGQVAITQQDLDEISFKTLNKKLTEDAIHLNVTTRTAQ
jgi:hypothetical protein